MEFDIGTILSVAYGKLLTEDIGKVYKMLNYMFDTNLFTHQLPKAARVASECILDKYPQLRDWKTENEKVNTENWKEYRSLAREKFGHFLEIEKVDDSLYEPVNWFEEAVKLMRK